ncbi:MAG: hypothetical protein IKW50_02395 [Oscillospiraceae bacterium]|nr:hypothetical protein [Oscillospiraceae bacterium]
MTDLADMIDVVIGGIERKISGEKNPAKLYALLDLYRRAGQELRTTGAISTNLIGGVRAYLDSYSDYMNNQLLDDMYAVEKAIKAARKRKA